MFSMSIQAASPKATSVKFKRSFISGKESMLVQGLDAQKKLSGHIVQKNIGRPSSLPREVYYVETKYMYLKVPK